MRNMAIQAIDTLSMSTQSNNTHSNAKELDDPKNNNSNINNNAAVMQLAFRTVA